MRRRRPCLSPQSGAAAAGGTIQSNNVACGLSDSMHEQPGAWTRIAAMSKWMTGRENRPFGCA